MNLYVRNVYSYVTDDTKKYFVYIGETDVSGEILCGEIGPIDDDRVYISVDGLSSMVLFTDRVLIIRRDSNVRPLYVKGKMLTVDAHSFTTLINAVSNELLNQYNANIISESSKNYDSITNSLNDIAFPEQLLRLLNWNITKKRLKFNKKKFVKYVARFNIYFAYYGTNIGSEINKLRPVLIWKQHVNSNNMEDNSYFVFPLSSKKSKKNYNYHVKINVNGNINYIRINDGKRISIRRIDKPLVDKNTGKTYVLEQEKIDEVKTAISAYFSL